MSRRKDRLVWVLVIGLLLAVGVTAYVILWPRIQPQTTLRLGDGVFTARAIPPKDSIAQEIPPADWLRQDRAVLRIYDHEAMWAVDMQVRSEQVDVVWLDKSKKIVHIVKYASAKSPKGPLFRPSVKAKYIVEFIGGTVDQKTMMIDSKAVFDETDTDGALQL